MPPNLWLTSARAALLHEPHCLTQQVLRPSLRAMDVQPAEKSAMPAYPERNEFLRQRNLLGASLLGAGMLLGACEQRPVRTAGVPSPTPRPMGTLPVPAGHSNKAQQPGKTSTTPKTVTRPTTSPNEPPGRTMGKIRVEPATIDPPPRLMGDVMVVPKPDVPPQDPPKKEDPPRLPGEPPPR